MSSLRRPVPAALIGIGGAMIALAVAWWWATYRDVATYGYLSWPEAGRCLVQNSDICALARALCLGSHPRLLLAYWTGVFWIGLAVLSISPFTGDRAERAQRNIEVRRRDALARRREDTR